VVKVGVFVYDKVFGSSVIPKATTLLIQDGGVKGHNGIIKIDHVIWATFEK